MIDLDDELTQEYLEVCRDHLASMEADLLALEKGGPAIDRSVVQRVLEPLEWIQQKAAPLGLGKMAGLARRMEDVLVRVLSGQLAPKPERVRVLLRALDRLKELAQDPEGTRHEESREITDGLRRLRLRGAGRGGLRTLLVEDDFTSRLVLQTFFSRYGECHIAVNGKEAVAAVAASLEHGPPYDLISMDIMMPEMDGREAVRQARALEQARGIHSTEGARIIMTTAVDDLKEVVRCFHELCDAYLVKPIDLDQLLGHMKRLQLVR